MVPAGCIERVVRHLKQAGYGVQIVDDRDCSFSPIRLDEHRRQIVETNAPGLADAISSRIQGCIEVATGKRKSHILGCLCQILHPSRIFIACKTIKETRAIAGDLRTYLGGEVDAVRGLEWRSPCRVVCGTFHSLNRSEPADWPVLIFADALDGTQRTNNDARVAVRERTFALIDPRHHQPFDVKLQIEFLAGPVIYRDPQLPQSRSAVLTAAFATHASCDIRPSLNARDHRVTLSQDDRRNQAIAKVAMALSKVDDASLLEHDLVIDQRDPSPLCHGLGSIIFVDSVQHGEQLRRLLPGWNLIHGRHTPYSTSPDGVPLSMSSWVIPRNSIMTAVAAENRVILGGRVLIWASGGRVPYLPTVLSQVTDPCFLIDFWDDGNHQLAADTLQRLGVYKSLDCRVLGANLDQRERQLAQQIESHDSILPRSTSRRRRRQQRSSA